MTVTRLLEEASEEEIYHWQARAQKKPMREAAFEVFSRSLRAITFNQLSFTNKRGKPDDAKRKKAIKLLLPDFEP
jgi:hypothetical protein